MAYGRYAATRLNQATDIIYVGEGVNASVAVSELSNGVRNYHNAGKVQASSEPQDMRLQRMLGHLTTLIPKQAKKVLVIGCGAGVTAGAVSIDPAVEHETIAEIEPLVPRVVSDVFQPSTTSTSSSNPKVHVRIDDARHFVETTDEKFDAITSDPLDPWVKGAAMLYTVEFFEMVKKRLNPGGVVTLFVQLYESNTEAVKSEIGTFLEVFPNGIVWGNTSEGKGYDLVLLGQVEPTTIDVDAIEAKLQRPEYAPMKQSLREIGMNSAVDLFATYAGRKPDLEPWLRNAQINHDRNLRLQYLAGMGLNLYQADVIYADMLRYVTKMPDDLFIASEATKQSLFTAIQRAQGRGSSPPTARTDERHQALDRWCMLRAEVSSPVTPLRLEDPMSLARGSRRLASSLRSFGFAAVCGAQTFRGGISGRVADQTGAVLPGVTVTATNDATGVARTTTTSDSGDFSVPDLPARHVHRSKRRCRDSRPCARKVEVTRLADRVGRAEDGAVAGRRDDQRDRRSALMLDTVSTALSNVVRPKQVQDLPLNGRDFTRDAAARARASPARR